MANKKMKKQFLFCFSIFYFLFSIFYFLLFHF